MTDKQFEQIECLSKKLWEDINNGYEYSMVTYTEFLGIVTEVWERLQEEPVSEDLGEAADKFVKSYIKGGTKQSWLKEGYIAGAMWKEEQMIAKAIDARCFGFQGDALFSFKLPADNYLVGSKVKVIVIKED